MVKAEPRRLALGYRGSSPAECTADETDGRKPFLPKQSSCGFQMPRLNTTNPPSPPCPWNSSSRLSARTLCR